MLKAAYASPGRDRPNSLHLDNQSGPEAQTQPEKSEYNSVRIGGLVQTGLYLCLADLCPPWQTREAQHRSLVAHSSAAQIIISAFTS